MITVKRINIYRKNGDVISIPNKSLRQKPFISQTESGKNKISIDFCMTDIKYNWKDSIDSKSLLRILREYKDVDGVELENSNKRTYYSVPHHDIQGKNKCQFLLCPKDNKKLSENNYILIFK